MKRLLLLTIFAATLISVRAGFLDEQRKYSLVQSAFNEKAKQIDQLLQTNDLNTKDLRILILAFKEEGKLEIYAKKRTENNYKKLITYDICARSGLLGPKRKSGDRQVPEGFYTINRFNTTSSYYLSLGISYPNAVDLTKSKGSNPGGDIFIHGKCVTIGCLPMTDDKIKEIYLYAVYARNGGQLKIPVYIFPFRMTDANMKKHSAIFKNSPDLLLFWKNIKTGYDQFEKSHKELEITSDHSGNYHFK